MQHISATPALCKIQCSAGCQPAHASNTELTSVRKKPSCGARETEAKGSPVVQSCWSLPGTTALWPCHCRCHCCRDHFWQRCQPKLRSLSQTPERHTLPPMHSLTGLEPLVSRKSWIRVPARYHAVSQPCSPSPISITEHCLLKPAAHVVLRPPI